MEEAVSSRPSTSQESSAFNESIDIEFKSEKQEIADLGLKEELQKVEKEIDDRDPTISFACESCGMNEMCHYEGTSPPFASTITLCEDSFVMRDPFQPFPPRGKSKAEYFIVLGARCCICDKVVCKDAKCSFFYSRTFCMDCSTKSMSKMPLEVQTRFRKQTSNMKGS